MSRSHAKTRIILSIVFLLAPLSLSAQNWPSFRGESARGVADGQDLPVTWNTESGENIRWKREIPGMGHASPIIWGDRVFLITAVAEGEVGLVLGDEGGIELSDDDGGQSWWIYALDAASGAVVWSKEAYTGPPRAKRHVKSSHANSTPVTDGETVVAIFGSQGMVAYDMTGRELWRGDLGVLDPGLHSDPTSSWGYASSPVVWRDLVIVQVDRHSDSFLAAYDLATGEKRWSVARDEKPIWATPTLHTAEGTTQLIVVGANFDRGYDPATGKELWRFRRKHLVKTTTPIVAGDLIILSGGYRGMPLYALNVGARGNASVPKGETTAKFVAWISEPGGPYTSTPVAYGDQIYFARNTGIFTALSLATGERVYRERLDSTFSASAVASDGKIFLAGEDGVVSVVKAGPEFELVGRSEMGEPIMATPAISNGTLFVRTRSALFAIGRGDDQQ